jgi:hypothetical protein
VDEVARQYLLVALGLGELGEGIVDAYYGPPEIKDEAAARHADAATLATEAAVLRERVEREVVDPLRARWLDRQLVALETLGRRMAGEDMDYVDEVTRCFDAAPERTPSDDYARVRAALDDLLPPGGSLTERLEARDARLTIPGERLGPVLDWVVDELRRDCAEWLPIPDGESLELSIVTGQPWSAYNWYDGHLRSRIEFNTDLPTRAYQLIGTLGHETFPGHHLEHAWKEKRLVRDQGHAEATVQLINTPEAYISEGLAEVGPRLMVGAERWQELLRGACERSGIPLSADEAAREWAITQAVRPLRGASGDAALMFHADGRPADEVRQFLVDNALATPERADKNIEFISHPLWRTYVFCYAGGERLLTRWVDAGGSEDAQRDRFFRLLTEPLTPSGVAAEIATA